MKVFNKKIKIEFVCILFLYIGVAIFNVMQPMISSKLLDCAIEGNVGKVKINAVYLLIVTVLLLVIELLRKIATSDYKKRITDILREKLLNGILLKTYKEFNEKNHQKYISLFNNEIKEIVENYYILFIDILFSIFSIIIYSLSLLSLNPLLAITVFITNLFPMIVPRFFRVPLQNKKSNYLELLQKYNVKIGDAINGYEVIKINNIRKKIEKVISKYGRDSSNEGRRYENTTYCCDMITALFSYINYLSMIILGVYLIYVGKLTAGGLLATVSVSELLVGPVTNISYYLNSYYGISKVKKSIFKEYYSEDSSIKKFKEISEEINTIQIENVSYYYGNKVALKSINLNFEKGKKYLIYGLNGSGKSTLFKIISKMYNDYEGRVLINGIELNNISEENYYSKFGIVMQQPFMFNDTLISNLTLYDNQYKNKVIEEIIDFLHLNRIKNMILSNKEYIDSENNISGGERQKINLARIIIQNKKNLFLDEATSAYDLESYQDILKKMLQNKKLTIINIEHKVQKEMLYLYDEIIVMENGRVAKICRTLEEKKEFTYVL